MYCLQPCLVVHWNRMVSLPVKTYVFGVHRHCRRGEYVVYILLRLYECSRTCIEQEGKRDCL